MLTEILGIGGSLLGGLIGSKGASDAAAAQTAAAGQANALQREMYYTNREDLAPWREAGGIALNKLLGTAVGQASAASPGGYWTEPEYTQGITGYKNEVGWDGGTIQVPIYGNVLSKAPQWIQQPTAQAQPVITGGQPGLIDYATGPINAEQLRQTPGYQFRMGEGLNALSRSMAQRGKLDSSRNDQAIMDYSQGLASTEYQNETNRRMNALNPWFQMAGLGSGATYNTANLGANYANQMGQNMLFSGNAQAGGDINQANAMRSMIQGPLNWYMYNQGRKGPSSINPASDLFYDDWYR